MNVAPCPRLAVTARLWDRAFAFAEARLSEMAVASGTSPAPPTGPPLPPRFLRHADEHTVVGIRAVLQALADHPRPAGLAGHAVDLRLPARLAG